eukprot:CAMPEP_0198346290 /NCGR_PEP_ID=MMETSP1450-20131203/78749_1 /TAXON_ID=753684 ORGANISM="Madagascaria erythrocladiodes, Strain CCMP3234" /NCGR_SAMPLE_ID=MMETSP1450 /ASSEMBLY_ACC=CAM_ASM_001115 /LENGTH=47 /DNA_ID= /DNA_START= /DNA_END= /DNA_ORIENTATION=
MAAMSSSSSLANGSTPSRVDDADDVGLLRVLPALRALLLSACAVAAG